MPLNARIPWHTSGSPVQIETEVGPTKVGPTSFCALVLVPGFR